MDQGIDLRKLLLLTILFLALLLLAFVLFLDLLLLLQFLLLLLQRLLLSPGELFLRSAVIIPTGIGADLLVLILSILLSILSSLIFILGLVFLFLLSSWLFLLFLKALRLLLGGLLGFLLFGGLFGGNHFFGLRIELFLLSFLLVIFVGLFAGAEFFKVLSVFFIILVFPIGLPSAHFLHLGLSLLLLNNLELLVYFILLGGVPIREKCL